MSAFNTPNLRNESGEGKVKRYVHQPLTGDHYGTHYKIQENGKVLITSAPDQTTGEYDEVEIPASLIFKLGTLLKATRQIQYVAMAGEHVDSEKES